MIKKFLILALIFVSFSSKLSYALVEIDITRGNLDPLPIAVSPLFVQKNNLKNPEFKEIGERLGVLFELFVKLDKLDN